MFSTFNQGKIIGTLFKAPIFLFKENEQYVIEVYLASRYQAADNKIAYEYASFRMYTDTQAESTFVTAMKKGRLVMIDYHLHTKVTRDKDGKAHPELQAIVDNFAPLESESIQITRQNNSALQDQQGKANNSSKESSEESFEDVSSIPLEEMPD